MRKFLKLAPMVAGVLLVVAAGTAQASLCGVDRYCAAPRAGASGCSCCQPQYCIVMRTCQEVVYDYQEQTFYKTVYEDVKDVVTVPGVKYVEETAYRCVPVTVMQQKQPDNCAPAAPCVPANPCAPAAGPELCPVQVLQRCPVPAYRAVPFEQKVEHSRVVAKVVPYTITVCIPRVVCKQVPVQVCCPLPRCRPSCCCQKPCGSPACCPAANP